MLALATDFGFKVLCVGAHPDDIELGCGGAICQFLKAGWAVICIFVTKGERGGDPALRVRESVEACARLGVPAENVCFGDFPDTQVPDMYDVIAFLERFVDPAVRMVLVPSVHDRHQDHRHVAESALTAFRRVPTVLGCESPSVTPEFQPRAFVDITNCLRDKAESLRCHRSQIAKKPMCLEYKSMLRLASFRGHQAGVRYAEAFEVLRHLVEPQSRLNSQSHTEA